MWPIKMGAKTGLLFTFHRRDNMGLSGGDCCSTSGVGIMMLGDVPNAVTYMHQAPWTRQQHEMPWLRIYLRLVQPTHDWNAVNLWPTWQPAIDSVESGIDLDHNGQWDLAISIRAHQYIILNPFIKPPDHSSWGIHQFSVGSLYANHGNSPVGNLPAGAQVIAHFNHYNRLPIPPLMRVDDVNGDGFADIGVAYQIDAHGRGFCGMHACPVQGSGVLIFTGPLKRSGPAIAQIPSPSVSVAGIRPFWDSSFSDLNQGRAFHLHWR